jgi:hypothetical protein
MRKLLTATLLSLAVGTGSAYAAAIVVKVRPPRAVVAHRDHAPSRDHVWVPGYHRWEGRAMGTRPLGASAAPACQVDGPRREHRRDEWVFREGRWR